MKRKSKTDWMRVKAMKDAEIDYSDIPPLEKDFFKKAILWPGTKKQIDEEGQVFILHLAIGKQKGAGGISNAECGVRTTDFRL
jgi:hypothetical protein